MSKYPHYPAEKNLQFASADAETFARLLEQLGGVQSTIRLTDEEATRETILDTLENLVAGGPTERLFVFFSGHGEVHRNTEELYLMPSDANPNRLAATGLLATDFITKLKAIGAKHVFLFLDACHTGAALRAKGTSGTDDRINALNRAFSRSYTAFLSSSADEVSMEDPEAKLGLFTSVIVRGLKGDADGRISNERDGRVTVGELKAYLSTELPARAQRLFSRAQTPVFSEQLHSDFILTTTTSRHLPERPTPTSGSLLSISDFERISSTDPQLGLLLHVEAASAGQTPPEMSRSEFVARLLRSMERASWRKIGQVPTTLSGGTISADGSVYVGCTDTNELRVFHFDRDGMKPFKIGLLGPSSARRDSWVLDACRVSISHDSRWVSVSVRAVDGEHWVELFQLKPTPRVLKRLSGARSAGFSRNLLVSVQEQFLTVFDPERDEELRRQAFSGLVSVSTEPSGYLLELSFSSGKNEVYSLTTDNTFKSMPPLIGYQNEVPQHFLSADWFIRAYAGRGMWFLQPSGGSFQFDCLVDRCRPLPSGVLANSGSWLGLYLDMLDPHALYIFGGEPIGRRAVRTPEPVGNARMLSTGSILMIGQGGGVFRMHSENYVSCCLISEIKDSVVDFTIDDEGTIALLLRRGDRSLATLVSKDGSHEYLLPQGFNPARITPVTAKSVLVSAEEKTLHVRFGSSAPLVDEIACGYPLSLAPNNTELACLGSSGQILLINMNGFSLIRKVAGHAAPIQDIHLDEKNITVAGSFLGRPQSVITTWQRLSGKLSLSRSCTHPNQASPGKSYIVDRGYTLVVETETHRTWYDATTCDITWQRTTAGTSGFVPTSRAPSGLTWLTSGVVSLDGPLTPNVERPRLSRIVKAAISPSGNKVAVTTPRHLILLPVTDSDILAVAKASASRSLTVAECSKYFPQTKCPSFN